MACACVGLHKQCHMSHSVLAFLLHDVLGVLQHLLLPQIKKVGGIRVKLQGFPAIIPADKNIMFKFKLILQTSKKVLCIQCTKKLRILKLRMEKSLRWKTSN